MRPIQAIQVINWCHLYIVPVSSNLQVLRQMSITISGKESAGQAVWELTFNQEIKSGLDGGPDSQGRDWGTHGESLDTQKDTET